MAKKHGPNKDNLEATRRVFLKIARQEFSSKGYYNASTADIVEESKMARGSLYYHFGDKKGLFKSVYTELMIEMQAGVRAAVADCTTAWDALMTGCMKILDDCTDNATRRIVVDVHTALSYRERYEVLQQTLVKELLQILQGVFDEGYFKGHKLNTLAMIIFGVISETGRSFEVADDIPAARKAAGEAIQLFLEKARD